MAMIIAILSSFAFYFLQVQSSNYEVDMPLHLKNIGLKLFKTQERFDEILSNMSQPIELVIQGTKILLVQNQNDNGITNLKAEFTHNWDGYGLKRIGNQPSGTMVDIGANIGSISILIAKNYPNWRVLAFEPIPTTYFYFRYNMYLNNITEITGLTQHGGIHASNHAVGSQNSMIELTYSDHNSQGASVSDVKDGWNGWHKINITVVSFQHVIHHFNLDTIDFFKIDCEGCEFDVLPSIRNIFVDKNKMKYVGAEIHQSLMNPRDTPLAKRPNATCIQQTVETLHARGCPSNAWAANC